MLEIVIIMVIMMMIMIIITMIIIIVIIITIIIIMMIMIMIMMMMDNNKIAFLERLPMSNMLSIKYVHIRHPKQHVSKQSCSNIQLSCKDG